MGCISSRQRYPNKNKIFAKNIILTQLSLDNPVTLYF